MAKGISTDYILIIIAFVIIIGLTSCCAAKGVVPYYKDSIFAQQYPYEPYTNIMDGGSYSPAPVSAGAAAPSVQQAPTVYKKVGGFNGIYPSPSAVEPNVDLFIDLEGNSKCFNGSSGLSNSMGALCLTPDLKNALLTRGGNLTGADSQIGSS
jgi:hypothetical protein